MCGGLACYELFSTFTLLPIVFPVTYVIMVIPTKEKEQNEVGIYDTKEYKDSLKLKVSYEWWIEQTTNDEYSDIEDCYKIDFKEWPVDSDKGCTAKLVLKR